MTDQVRISVQLINALNDSHLWAETYDRELIDTFQVESDVAEKIAGVLDQKVRHSSSESPRKLSRSAAHDPLALVAGKSVSVCCSTFMVSLRVPNVVRKNHSRPPVRIVG